MRTHAVMCQRVTLKRFSSVVPSQAEWLLNIGSKNPVVRVLADPEIRCIRLSLQTVHFGVRLTENPGTEWILK